MIGDSAKLIIMTRSDQPDEIARLVLEVNDLTVSYGNFKAVDKVSFSTKAGEIFGLIGPNGAGKTTTLSAIENLIKPDSGNISLNGLDIFKHQIESKANIGVQLQSTSFQYELNIIQLIKLYSGLYNVALTESQINDSLEKIGLSHEAKRRFKQLSGGQQQRLSLFIANIHHPMLLLLDEPTAGLDPQSRRQLWDTIESNRHDGGSILLTTHSMEEAQAVCDRVAIMDVGKIIVSDTPEQLIETYRTDPRVIEVARKEVTLEDVFIGLTGGQIRE